ncbi:MAG: polymerase subunit epsilon [Alphaproteobacteria bacterium]|nr:polymerase subunit epsilon [Alphaproteobacteria bacterium]
MRHIVLDTETTGFNAETTDRIVEIGALELINFVPTGKVFHQYINPERTIPAEVVAVHGIDDAMVRDKPVYAQIVDELDRFIGTDSQLVIHNAEFDMRFLNAEYKRLGLPPLPMSRAIDTLAMARKMFPGAPASLDALCKRYNIDISARVYHGALLDARLLADVFLELSGGHQPQFLASRAEEEEAQSHDVGNIGTLWPVRAFPVPAEEEAAHAAMLATIKDAIWTKAA